MKRWIATCAASAALFISAISADAQTAIQFGVTQTDSPPQVCAFDGTNTCQPFMLLPDGGPAIIPSTSGGSGISSPTAHSLMIGDGASPFNLLNATTGGRMVLDQGTGADPAYETMSGDATLAGSGALTLGTVNSNVGSFGSSTAIPYLTVNAKGLVTAAGTNAVIAPAGTLTGSTLASNVTGSSLTSVGTLSSLTMGGLLTTSAPTTGGAGFILAPGTTPTSPVNGSFWMTSAGIFGQVNGATVGPLAEATTGSFAAATPLSVGAAAGVVTYSCATCTIQPITRAQIPTTHLPTSGTITLSGYRTADDPGAGAVYVFCGTGAGCSTGLEAIADANGNYWTLQLTNVVNVGWFGAYGNGSANAIVSGDISANPQWRGCYASGSNWDFVSAQEAQYAAYANASAPCSNEIGKATIASYLPDGVGAGCTSGSQTFTVEGGTGTAATITATVSSGGALESPLVVATAGNYTAFPASPATLSGGSCTTPPTVILTPSNIVWNSSPSRNSTLNKNLLFACALGSGSDDGTNYVINEPMTAVASEVQMDFCSGAELTWSGTTTASMWYWDSVAYGVVNRMFLNDPQQGSFWTTAPLLSLDYTGTNPGLRTQNLVFNNPFIGVQGNGRGISLNGIGGSAAQGSTITFNNLECVGSVSDYCFRMAGDNALNVTFNNKDIQGFAHDGIQDFGGQFTDNSPGGSSENEEFYGNSFTPTMDQLTTYGADDHCYSSILQGNPNAIGGGLRSESDVGALGPTCNMAIDGYTTYGSSSDGWYASSPYTLGSSLWAQPGCGSASGCETGSKYWTWILVDDGGNGSWPAITSFTSCTITDSSANYTTNQWAGYELFVRNFAGSTYEALIASNTPTTITVSPCYSFGTIPGGDTGALYHVGGLTGLSAPAWDSATVGGEALEAVQGDNGGGFATTAGSDSVTVDGSIVASGGATPQLVVNDYVMIPGADCLGSGPYQFNGALFAKVTNVSGLTLTLNKSACNTVPGPTNTTGMGYWGAGVTDGQMTWMNLDFDAFQGSLNSTLKGYSAGGRIYGFANADNYQNQRLDKQRPDNPQPPKIAGGYGTPPSFNQIAGVLNRGCTAVTAASTIDLSTYLQEADCLTLTPTGNETLEVLSNLPTPVSMRQVTLFIVTSGTSSDTLTCSTHMTCNGTLATGTVSGVTFPWVFQWNGTAWQETSRPPNAGAGSYLLASNNLSDVLTPSTARTNLDLAPSTGLAISGSNLLSNAENTNAFYPGPASSVSSTKGGFTKWVKASTVDNIEGSASAFVCSGNPTITFYECGTSTTCASSPTTIGSVTVTAAGTAADGSINSAAIAAGDYTAWEISAGTCTSLDIAGMAQVHSN